MEKIRIGLAALALCAPAIASAVPVTIDFTVTTTMSEYGGAIIPGYQAGNIGTGYFTFDNAYGSVPAVAGGAAALDLSVSWMGQTWDEVTARIGYLNLNNDGSVRGWVIGGMYEGDCGPGCVAYNGPSDFWVGTDNGVFSSLIHVADKPGYIYASTTWSVRPANVPEPGVAVLMSIGLLGVWAARRRTRRSI